MTKNRESLIFHGTTYEIEYYHTLKDDNIVITKMKPEVILSTNKLNELKDQLRQDVKSHIPDIIMLMSE